MSEPERPALSVDADLTLRTDGAALSVVSVGTGERLLVEAPSLCAGIGAARAAPAAAALDDLDAALRAADIAAEFRVHQTTLGTLGAGSEPGPLARELGLAPVDPRVGGVLAAVGRAATLGVRRVARLLG